LKIREIPDGKNPGCGQNDFCMKNFGLAILILAAGCSTSSHKASGKFHPAISPDDVVIYTFMPARAQIVGTVRVNSFYGATWQQASDDALDKLKIEAAKLGANGIVMSPPNDKASEGASLEGNAIFISP
jgi:hypothetical protein